MSLQTYLSRAPRPIFIGYATVASFATYFCMYAFRKPFVAASYEGLLFWGTEVELKTAFVITQIIGYALSKYVGVKLVSEIRAERRAAALIGLITVAEAGLLLFAVLPGSLKVVGLFVNGLTLGMIWGLVVRYLEGRRSSELLLVGLSTSFIVASGAVKDVGRYLMRDLHVSEYWMPFTTGALFFPAFAISVWFLNQLPAPDDKDIAERVERKPMDAKARIAFVRQFAGGLIPLFVVYVATTAIRDFRDNYGVELFAALGYKSTPGLFTQTEVPVALFVLLAVASLNLVKDNSKGLSGAHIIMIAGALLVGGTTFLLDRSLISGIVWMSLTGLGSYLVYVPFNSVLFDRMIAATRAQGTAVFAIYVADALGYTGSISAQLYKDLGDPKISRLSFFRGFTYGFAVIATILLAFSMRYFARRSRPPARVR